MCSTNRRDLLRNTVVMVASDHGEHFGEHGIFGHNRSLYTQETHVPLVISVPGEDFGGPLRIATPVSLRELASTVLDLARVGPGPSLPGMSLSRFWRLFDLTTDPLEARDLAATPLHPPDHAALQP
jgi:arylsulfatase A-like enzyme